MMPMSGRLRSFRICPGSISIHLGSAVLLFWRHFRALPSVRLTQGRKFSALGYGPRPLRGGASCSASSRGRGKVRFTASTAKHQSLITFHLLFCFIATRNLDASLDYVKSPVLGSCRRSKPSGSSVPEGRLKINPALNCLTTEPQQARLRPDQYSFGK